MKKIGKIFGIGALAFATLTAGVIGLSGCGERWKNPDKDPNPEEPPAIVTPPTEERPLIGVVSLSEIKEYLSDTAVKTSFDGLKIASSVPNDGVDGFCGYEFYALVGENPADMKMSYKELYGEKGSVTSYVRGEEKVLYVKSETSTEVLTEKLTKEESFNQTLSNMEEIYSGAIDVSNLFDNLNATWKTFKDFKYSAVRTRIGQDVSYAIDLSYSNKEEKDGDVETLVDVNYTGKCSFYFENSAIVKYELKIVRQEKGSMTKSTASVVVDNLTEFELPADLDTYPENLTIAEANAFLNNENIKTAFDGLEITVKQSGLKDGVFKAVKRADTFKSAAVNTEEQDDIIYYYSSEENAYYTINGEEKLKISKADQVQAIATAHNTYFETYKDVKSTFASLAVEEESRQVKISRTTPSNKVELLVEVERTEFDEVAQKNYVFTAVLKIIFADNAVEKVKLHNVQKEADTEELVFEAFVEINKISDLSLPADRDTYTEIVSAQSVIDVDFAGFIPNTSLSQYGFKASIVQDGFKEQTIMTDGLGASGVQIISKNVYAEDDNIYYYRKKIKAIDEEDGTQSYVETECVVVWNGLEYALINDPSELELISMAQQEIYNQCKSAKDILNMILEAATQDANAQLLMKKSKNGENLEYVLLYSYETTEEESQTTYNISGSLSLLFLDDCINEIKVDAIEKNLEDETSSALHITITKFDNSSANNRFERPVFPDEIEQEYSKR